MKRRGEQIRKTTVNKIREQKWKKKTMITKSGKQKSGNRKEKSGKQG